MHSRKNYQTKQPVPYQPSCAVANSRRTANIHFVDDDFVGDKIRAGERAFDRLRDLPSLLHLFPNEIERLDRVDATAILQKLKRATQAERRRGLIGHWRYSLSRHIALRQALAHEIKLRTV